MSFKYSNLCQTKNRMTLKEDIVSMLISLTPFKWKKKKHKTKTDCIRLRQEKQMEKKNLFEFPFEARNNKESLPCDNTSLSFVCHLTTSTQDSNLKRQNLYFPFKRLSQYLGRLGVSRAEKEQRMHLWPSTRKDKAIWSHYKFTANKRLNMSCQLVWKIIVLWKAAYVYHLVSKNKHFHVIGECGHELRLQL